MLNHHVKSYDEHKPSIILLHGFISDHTSFHIVESTLRNKGLNVITIDLPGHGHDESSYDEIWSMDFIVSKIKEVIDYLELDKIYLHGYSMGGRVALSFAVQYPELLSGLILESASPGLKDSSDKQNRIEVDYNRATRIQEIGLQQFVEEWSKLPLFNSQSILSTGERERIKQMRLSQNPNGLSKALKDYGTGSQPSNWHHLNTMNVPTCIIVGQKDEKFIQIGKQMNESIKNSK